MNSSFDQNNRQPILVKWKKVHDEVGPTPRPRHGHRAVAINDLMIVFGGGNDGIVDELHVYNVSNNKWYMPQVRGDVPHGFAAYGMLTYDLKVFIFGGMVEHGRYSNAMFELQTNRWEWRTVRVRAPKSGQPGPCPRLGHSFTLGLDKFAYVFGGLANDSDDPRHNVPRYLNDFYAINLTSSPYNLGWEAPVTHGPSPPPRESHSAVHFATQTGKEQLIIYGGMDGTRMNDVWILDLASMNWSNPYPNGQTPMPRSLHTANLVGNRMFVFGGWVPLQPGEKAEQPDKEWKCTNSLAVLNLKTLTWENTAQPLEDNNISEDPIEPRARAGHCAVVINKRIYIWSGRDGYKKSWDSQVCCDDLWFLEVEPPCQSPPIITLSRANTNSLEVQWPADPNADKYLLQIQRVDPQAEAEQKAQLAAKRSVKQPLGSAIRMIRPSTIRQHRPVMMMHRPLSATSTVVPYVRAPSSLSLGASPQRQRTIIVQKAGPNQTPQQQKKLVVISQAGPQKQATRQFIQVQSIASPSQPGFDVLQSQPESSAFIPGKSTVSTTTKTTYTAPVTPAIDQTMPTNILDEAMNEAESFVDEQLQKQMQTPSPKEEANPGQNAKEEKIEDNKTDEKDDSLKEGNDSDQIEQMRATPDKKSVEKELDPVQQPHEDQPLDEDVPIEEHGHGQTEEAKETVSNDEGNAAVGSEQASKNEEQTANVNGTSGQQGNQQPDQQITPIPTAADQWFDVATLEDTKFKISQYLVPMPIDSFGGQEQANQQQYGRLVNLEPGVVYKLRYCAINSVGRGGWSPVSSFRTCLPGFPGAPCFIRITKKPDGAHITWDPPQVTNGLITEYTVYLAMRSGTIQPQFVPVYVGRASNCVVNQENLQLSHIDATQKPAVIFRIAARNAKGYGPATQVRWLQNTVPRMSPTVSVTQPTPVGMKRSYAHQQQQQSPMQQYMQVPVNRSGSGDYYATMSGGTPRFVVRSSAASSQSGNVSVSLPHVQQQTPLHVVQSTSPATSGSVRTSVSYASSSPRQMPQQQQTPSSIQIVQQQKGEPADIQHAAIIQQHGPEDASPQQQMTVREYLTGGNKRLRLE